MRGDAGDDDREVPYDRELIRSGMVSSGRPARRTIGSGAGATAPPARPRDRSRGRGWAQPRPRRRGGGWLRRLLLLTLAAVAVVVVLVGIRTAAFNASVSSAAFPSTALLGPLNGSDRVNVLLVGYGGGEHGGAYLADSIQVLSIDPTTDMTTTIPVPRDLWIEGVGASPANVKVNEVFSRGNAAGGLDVAGADLAAVLSDVLGLDIDHWMSIDFAGFEEMVDAVGGVTIDNPVAFDYAMTESAHRAGDWSVGGFAAGELQLDGAEALAYARARYTSAPSESSDFARSVRQARILAALRGEIGGGGLGAVIPGLRLMGAMEGRVRTDLSAIDLALLAPHLGSDRRLELTEGVALSASSNTSGQYILVPIGWSGPGDYGGLRDFVAAGLARAS